MQQDGYLSCELPSFTRYWHLTRKSYWKNRSALVKRSRSHKPVRRGIFNNEWFKLINRQDVYECAYNAIQHSRNGKANDFAAISALYIIYSYAFGYHWNTKNADDIYWIAARLMIAIRKSDINRLQTILSCLYEIKHVTTCSGRGDDFDINIINILEIFVISRILNLTTKSTAQNIAKRDRHAKIFINNSIHGKAWYLRGVVLEQKYITLNKDWGKITKYIKNDIENSIINFNKMTS